MSLCSGVQHNRGGARRPAPPLILTWAAVFAVSLLLCKSPTALGQQSGVTAPLSLKSKIPLGGVMGRIDHMAVDLARRRLFVAELGNNTVGVVDLEGKKVVHRIRGLSEPQGIAYVPTTDTVFVANAGDGSVRVFRGFDYAQIARFELGSDADNVRFDKKTGRVLVGFGSGGIAAIDPAKNEKIAQADLPAHPESFQISPSSGRIFANLPDASSIAVLSGELRPEQTWKVRYGANFAMTIDPGRKRLLVAFRRPARVVVLDEESEHPLAETETCGDVDDLFHDAGSGRIYVICGSGAIDILDARSDKYSRIARLQTVAGTRTGVFVPELNSLFVGVRGRSPAIWRYRVNPAPD